MDPERSEPSQESAIGWSGLGSQPPWWASGIALAHSLLPARREGLRGAPGERALSGRSARFTGLQFSQHHATR